MSTHPEEGKLAAIMFTDMVGYGALSQLALELLEEHPSCCGKFIGDGLGRRRAVLKLIKSSLKFRDREPIDRRLVRLTS